MLYLKFADDHVKFSLLLLREEWAFAHFFFGEVLVNGCVRVRYVGWYSQR